MSDLGTSLLKMLDALDELPEDHEPDTEDLWETLRNIRKLVEKSQELGFTIDSYFSGCVSTLQQRTQEGRR